MVIAIDLESLAEELRNYEGVKRKRAINDLVTMLGVSDKVGGRTIAGFGEDAAVLDFDGDNCILLAVDGILDKLLSTDPWWAGYCAVLVNVNDIAAMGGTPLAMVNLTSTQRRDVCIGLGRGMEEGVKKFGVPMVGGHLHPDTVYDALDVAIMGRVRKDSIIFSSGAKPGDKVLVAIDLDGRVSPNYNLAWDTTTKKSPVVIKKQLETMVKIGEKKLATAGKDISNLGTVGTLGMLLESSGVGALVDLAKVPRPIYRQGQDVSDIDSDIDIPLPQWLKIYPGTGFVLTVENGEKGSKCIEIFRAAGITASIIGEIDASKRLRITDGEEIATVFDFNSDIITGIR